MVETCRHCGAPIERDSIWKWRHVNSRDLFCDQMPGKYAKPLKKVKL